MPATSPISDRRLAMHSFDVFLKNSYLFHELSPNAASLFSSKCGRRSEDDALLVLAEELDEGICLKINKIKKIRAFAGKIKREEKLELMIQIDLLHAMIRDDVLLVFRRWHFVLNDDWLDSVLSFLDRHNFLSIMTSLDRVVALVFEQLLLSDLSHSLSCGSLSQFNFNPATPKLVIQCPLIFQAQVSQVKGVKDIRQSEYSRLKNAEDQTDFESVMEIDRENDYNTSTRVLHLLLNDGERTVCGFEQCLLPLPAHCLFPPIGSKLLLLPPILCRNGILFLTPRNFQFLNGECNLPLTALSPSSVLSNSKSMSNQQPVDLSQAGKITRFLVKMDPNRN
ncbi:hypothetical protein WR25_16355 [Diploscapter pachys]|uniref:RecQ-mediated genome instability protein 1 n=1 Tax=Diploscapter pachys TaxID=2018661 RepID=A0A2A2LB80_9BILA|nr:hypothetical protein WR25_16355 [Diploscapter pachys]